MPWKCPYHSIVTCLEAMAGGGQSTASSKAGSKLRNRQGITGMKKAQFKSLVAIIPAARKTDSAEESEAGRTSNGVFERYTNIRC